MGRMTVTCKGFIAAVNHKRPETAGAAPGTKLTLDTEALEPEIAAKLFGLSNGHPVQITIEEIQDRMPMNPPQPEPPEGEEAHPDDCHCGECVDARDAAGVPAAFRTGWSPPEPPERDPNDPTQPV